VTNKVFLATVKTQMYWVICRLTYYEQKPTIECPYFSSKEFGLGRKYSLLMMNSNTETSQTDYLNHLGIPWKVDWLTNHTQRSNLPEACLTSMRI